MSIRLLTVYVHYFEWSVLTSSRGNKIISLKLCNIYVLIVDMLFMRD
jgi:hypothetical protein